MAINNLLPFNLAIISYPIHFLFAKCLYKLSGYWLQCKKSIFLTFVDAIAEDWVALPAAGLSVGEEGGVEALPGIVKDTPTQVLEHLTSKNTHFVFKNIEISVWMSVSQMCGQRTIYRFTGMFQLLLTTSDNKITPSPE
jgi:hypothetical protein